MILGKQQWPALFPVPSVLCSLEWVRTALGFGVTLYKFKSEYMSTGAARTAHRAVGSAWRVGYNPISKTLGPAGFRSFRKAVCHFTYRTYNTLQ